jgi:hypothetical protein
MRRRIPNPLVLVKFVSFLAWNALQAILSRRFYQLFRSKYRIRICVATYHLILLLDESIKPKGLVTPNFSRALNHFQKEDHYFRHGRTSPGNICQTRAQRV